MSGENLKSKKPKFFQVTAAKRSRLSVRTPAAGKRGVAKTGRGRRREETGPGGRGSDQVKSEEGAGVERIQYRWVTAGRRWFMFLLMILVVSEWESQGSSSLQSIVSSARATVKESPCPHHNIWEEPDSISYRFV